MFSFVFNIIYITERDIYKCGPLIRCEGPVMEEGGWHKRFSFLFSYVYRGEGEESAPCSQTISAPGHGRQLLDDSQKLWYGEECS